MKPVYQIIAVCFVFAQIHSIADESVIDHSSDPVKDHHFFVGVNLSIPYNENYYPVEKIWNNRAQIKVGDMTWAEKIEDIKQLRYSRKTKISHHFAEINDLTCEPGYSPGNDPQIKEMDMQMNLMYLVSELRDQSDRAMQREMEQEAMDSGGGSGDPSQQAPGMSGTESDDTEIFESMMEAQDLLSMAQAYEEQLYNFTDSSDRGPPSWDVLNIKFSLDPDMEIRRGHLVFIFSLKKEPDGEPVMTWFHFLTLNNIPLGGKQFDYTVNSYPIGMYIDSQEVSLYADGSEIATNLSPKHVLMTEENARTYLKYQYFTKNEHTTGPPQRAWRYLSQDVLENMDPSLIDEKIKLKIDEEGLVTDLIMSPFLEAALSPGYIRELSSQIYLPALEDGKPVPGDLNLTLREVVF